MFENLSMTSEKKAFRFLQRFNFIPKELREADLFVLGLTFIFLILLSQTLSTDLSNVINWEMASHATRKGGITYAIMLLILGAPLAVYVALTAKPWGKVLTYILPFFFVVVNVAIAFGLAFHSLDNPSMWVKGLAIWQILQAVVFIMFSGKKSVGDFYDIPSRQANLKEVVAGTVVVSIVTVISLFQNWYWAVTFSTVLFFWGIVDRYLNSEPIKNYLDKPLALGNRKKPTQQEKDGKIKFVAVLVILIALLPLAEAAYFNLIAGFEVDYIGTMIVPVLLLIFFLISYLNRARWAYPYTMALIGFKAVFALLSLLSLKQAFGLLPVLTNYPINISMILGLCSLVLCIWALIVFIRLYEEAR
jgi:hypothetical protein